MSRKVTNFISFIYQKVYFYVELFLFYKKKY